MQVPLTPASPDEHILEATDVEPRAREPRFGGRVQRLTVFFGAALVVVGGLLLSANYEFRGGHRRQTDNATLPTSALERFPRLEVAPATIDLGDGDPSEVLTGTISLKNTGNAQLDFAARAGCGCTRLEPERGTLGSGASALLKVGVKLPEYSNSERAVRVFLSTNDPAKPSVQCTVLARSRASFDVSPTALYFGDVDPGDPNSQSRTLAVRDRDGQPVRNPEDVTVHSTHRKVQTEWVRASNGAFDLRVFLKGLEEKSLEEGSDIRDEVVIGIAGAGRPLIVPVYASVDKPVKVIPSTVAVAAGLSGTQSKVIYVWTRQKTPLGPLTRVDAPFGITIEECGELRNGLRTLKLIVRDLTHRGTSTVTLHFQKLDRPVMLQVCSSLSQ